MQLMGGDCFRWHLGNGIKVFFWEDLWFEDAPLMKKILRLYRIFNLKHCSVNSFLLQCATSVKADKLWSRPLIDRDDNDV